MDDISGGFGKLATVILLAAGAAGCAAPNGTHPALFGSQGRTNPAQVARDSSKSDRGAVVVAARFETRMSLRREKIKAINELAHVGCGCYDNDGSVSQALVAAMGDDDEQVR